MRKRGLNQKHILLVGYSRAAEEYIDRILANPQWGYTCLLYTSEKILRTDNRWPVLYHLSPVRQNIVEWYPFEKEASVLEVGAGCGAISGALCRSVRRVVSVELSRRRSLINAYRNRECENLEIVVGNFNQIQLNEKFDYITLILSLIHI